MELLNVYLQQKTKNKKESAQANGELKLCRCVFVCSEGKRQKKKKKKNAAKGHGAPLHLIAIFLLIGTHGVIFEN